MGPAGQRWPLPIMSAGFFNGLGGSVLLASSPGWPRDALRALALVVVLGCVRSPPCVLADAATIIIP